MQAQKAYQNQKPAPVKETVPTYEFKSESSDIFSEASQSMSVQVVEATNNKPTLTSQNSSIHHRQQRKLLFGIEDSVEQLPFDYKQLLKQREEEEDLQKLDDEDELFEQLL